MASKRAWAVAAAVVAAVAGLIGWDLSREADAPAPGTRWVEPGSGIEFVWVPAGCGPVGSPDSPVKRASDMSDDRERPAHEVCVDGFWLGRTEVTRAQLRAHGVAAEGDGALPAVQVSWHEAQAFAAALGPAFRLPSEAEWEYACRAGGTHAEYCGEEPLHRIAHTNVGTRYRLHPAGQARANAWGLHDMSGNVREWTADCWHPDYAGAPARGEAWTAGGDCAQRMVRGGGWNTHGASARAATRDWAAADDRSDNLGFRLVRGR